MKPLSKQRRWQIKQKEAGNCTLCGSVRNLYSKFCDRCQKKLFPSGLKPDTRLF